MSIEELFCNLIIDENVYQEIFKIKDPKTKYVIAITPRSGSSYLCDLMTKSGLLGSPDEFLPPVFMKEILSNIPAKDSDEYLRHVIKKTQSENGISGLKTSWFQFLEFYESMKDPSSLNQFKYVYLYRRDVAQQAVSLYKATETSMFHTNIEHNSDTLRKVKSIKYDFEKIDEWKRHIESQELGWQNFFQKNRINPLRIS
jgi:LPS sulfotransferase NodH